MSQNRWAECPCCGADIKLPREVYDDFVTAYCKHCQQDQIIAGEGVSDADE